MLARASPTSPTVHTRGVFVNDRQPVAKQAVVVVNLPVLPLARLSRCLLRGGTRVLVVRRRGPGRVSDVKVLRFRDDDADGYEFQVLRSPDGDFWLSMRVQPEDYERNHGPGVPSQGGGIRVRTPMHGGGSHPQLFNVLWALWQGPGVALLAEPEARWLFKRHVNWPDGPFGLREKLAGLITRRRPNPRLIGWSQNAQGGPDFDEFLHELDLAVRSGHPLGSRWLDGLKWFSAAFLEHKMGKRVETSDDPAQVDAVVGAITPDTGGSNG